jgi:hypothetical protein
MNCSLYHKISDRLNITRTDQVYVYPRRNYRRQIRHNPYLLPVPIEEKILKIENDVNNELINSSEQTSNENFISENSMETIGNILDDQVVIPTEQIILNMNYQKKLKIKNHLNKCQSESEQK